VSAAPAEQSFTPPPPSSQPVAQPVTQPTTQPVVQLTAEPVAQPIAQPQNTQPQYQQPQYQPQQQPQYQQPQYQPQHQQPQYQQPQQQPQYQQGGSGMPVDKQTVLTQAPVVLNRPDQPWYVTVEGDAIVARWNWMNATWFAPHEVSNETRDFSFTVILDNKGTYKEVDRTAEKSSGVRMSGGKVGFGTSSSSFKGKTNQKSFSFGAGKDNQTGEVGLVGFKFNTSDVKNPVRAYLEGCGWKKAGFFG